MDVDAIVVGAGVVGLAVARALAEHGREVVVLERNTRIGAEISARNSEVVHAGLYYPPGSLRARLCAAGRDLLYGFAADNGVPVRRCGKLLVATSPEDIARLADIRRTAEANGVSDLVDLDAAGARRLEPELACVAALRSPSTGVVDSHRLMQALEGHLTAHGGSVVLETAVDAITPEPTGGFRLATRSASARRAGGDASTGAISCRHLVLAAGLGGTALADTVPFPRCDYRVPRTHPAKGHYFSLTGRAPFRHLVYPVPQGAWLGIHLTLDVAGMAKFGPDLEWCADVDDYSFSDPGGQRRTRFERDIRRYWPGLPDDALQPGYTGIRPKIYAAGKPAADFAIHASAEHGLAGLVALHGIESPGLTASLAIGEHVARLIDEGA